MLARLLLAAATIATSPVLADARELVVPARGPGLQTATKETFAQPFATATGIATQVSSWDGSMDTLRAQPKPPDNGWDLLLVDGDTLAAGCADGLFEKLDWSAIGGKDHYLPRVSPLFTRADAIISPSFIRRPLEPIGHTGALDARDEGCVGSTSRAWQNCRAAASTS